jgi:hypothetical protein
MVAPNVGDTVEGLEVGTTAVLDIANRAFMVSVEPSRKVRKASIWYVPSSYLAMSQGLAVPSLLVPPTSYGSIPSDLIRVPLSLNTTLSTSVSGVVKMYTTPATV